MKKESVSIRTRLTAFLLMAIIVSFMVGMYNFMSLQVLTMDMTDLLNTSQELTTLNSELAIIQGDLVDFLSTRNSESLQLFYDQYNLISEYTNELGEKKDYSVSGIKIRNLCSMIDHYLEGADNTVVFKRGNQTENYIEGYQQAKKEYSYIVEYIQQMMSSDLSNSAERYNALRQEIEVKTILNYAFFGITVLLIIVLIFLFSYSITKPISKLALYAEDVSKGNFDVRVEEDHSSREMNLLYRTFSMMIVSVKDYVDELHEKQKLVKTLSEEKINSLKIKNALREAELTALQAQINPHFIFNTINIGSRIAMLQGDQETCEYLEDTANVFRYNLKGLDIDATLQEEVDNVCAYMNLLIVRFGEVVKFDLNIPNDAEIKCLKIPRMTLQPLVENAYIHGISQNEEGGTIRLFAEKGDDCVYVTIANNGSVFPEEKIKSILQGTYNKKEHSPESGHTTGIGLDNVLKRLRLFYNNDDVMEIISSENNTKIVLKLMLNRNLTEQ